MLIDVREIIRLLKSFNINIKGILHIGAHMCEEKDAYNNFLKISDENIIWIDGNDDLTLKNKERGIPNCYTAVLDETERTTTFNITNNGQSSSILEFGTHANSYPWCKFIESRQVTTQTLGNFFKINNIDNTKYNFWNLDIQGVELQVLRGSQEFLSNVDAIYVEVNVQEVYKNCGQLHEIDSLLEKHGLFRVQTLLVREGWGDALYLRKST
jgi:FkbM family methyltransferase